MALPKDHKQACYAEYLTWNEKMRCEAIDGKIVNMSPSPTPKHQDVLGEISAEFRMYLRDKECRAFAAPIDVCLFAEKNTPFEEIKDWVQPDLVVVCDPNKIEEKRIVGAPDLVVEILSPSTAKHDRVLKYAKYEQAGIKEYWIVDAYHEFIEVYILDGKHYKRQGVYSKADTLPVSIFPEFKMNLLPIFRD